MADVTQTDCRAIINGSLGSNGELALAHSTTSDHLARVVRFLSGPVDLLDAARELLHTSAMVGKIRLAAGHDGESLLMTIGAESFTAQLARALGKLRGLGGVLAMRAIPREPALLYGGTGEIPPEAPLAHGWTLCMKNTMHEQWLELQWRGTRAQ